MYLATKGVIGSACVGVLESLMEDVLLGHDVGSLFAYRDVPQESSGFSPFSLLYGRWIRGPLAIAREAWTNVTPQEQNVASQVIEMRTRLAQMMDTVRNNMAKAQAKLKAWFDKGARCRQFEVGDMVLVLLPPSSSKLQAPHKADRTLQLPS